MDEEMYDDCGPINEKLFNFRYILNQNGRHVMFSDHKDNVETTKVLYEWLKEYNEIPNVALQHKKDNEKAKNLRMAANTQLSIGKSLLNILDNFNRSICWAEGEELALAYASRSYVYLLCKKYDICLENIELALKAGYPEVLMDKLNEHKSLCIEFLNNSNQNTSAEGVDDHFSRNEIKSLQRRREASKLNLNSDSNLSFVVDSLDLKNTSIKGRHYIAKTDLYPGQIVSIEEPFVNVLTKPYRFRKCANCFKENYMSLIPCKSCTCTMFCSEKCLNEAQKFHKFECPILEYIWEECEGYALTLRLVVKAFTTFDSVDGFIDSRKESMSQNIELTECVNDRQRYSYVCNQLTHEMKRNFLDMFLRCCKVAILYHFLIEKTELSQILQTDIHRDTLISLILDHSQISSLYAINTCQTNTLHLQHFLDQETDHVFAKGIYPFSSLFNHSCIPNTTTVSYEGKLLTYVTRPIKKKSQVYSSYQGVVHTNDKRTDRQNILSMLYHFVCNCEACVNYYPTYNLMLRYNYAIGPELERSTETIDVNNDIDNLDKLCTLLKRYDSDYPCPYLSRLWLRFKRAMTCKFGELSTAILLSLGDKKRNVLEEINLLTVSSRR